MNVRYQMLVATMAATAGLITLGLFRLIAKPDAGYRDIAIGTLIYAATYMVTVPRAEVLLSRLSFVPGDAPHETD
jgi:hypothetical protein